MNVPNIEKSLEIYDLRVLDVRLWIINYYVTFSWCGPKRRGKYSFHHVNTEPAIVCKEHCYESFFVFCSIIQKAKNKKILHLEFQQYIIRRHRKRHWLMKNGRDLFEKSGLRPLATFNIWSSVCLSTNQMSWICASLKGDSSAFPSINSMWFLPFWTFLFTSCGLICEHLSHLQIYCNK